MSGISAGNLLFGLNQAKSIEHKLNRLISKEDNNRDHTLSIKELGVNKDVFDRIDKNGDGQVGKFELVIAARALIRAAFNIGTSDPVLTYPLDQTEQKPSFEEYSSLDATV